MSKPMEVNPFIIFLTLILTTFAEAILRDPSLDFTTKILYILYSIAVTFLGLLFEFLIDQEEDRRWQERIKRGP